MHEPSLLSTPGQFGPVLLPCINLDLVKLKTPQTILLYHAPSLTPSDDEF